LITNGTTFNPATDPKVVRILEECLVTKKRLVILYGDVKTGKPWGDVLRGHIGRSTGSIKIPLLICTKRSTGGEGLLEHCIVEIRESKGGRVLYQLPRTDIEYICGLPFLKSPETPQP
jgi:hypothetical protein